MNISFRPIGKRERETLEALGVRHIPVGADGFPRGSVASIDGCIVVAFGRNDEVIYQDGSDAVADLVRAHKRVVAAVSTFTYEDYQRIKRKNKPPRTIEDILNGVGRTA